jgi:hypothetical protein
MRNVCIMDKALHRDLHGYAGGSSSMRASWHGSGFQS